MFISRAGSLRGIPWQVGSVIHLSVSDLYFPNMSHFKKYIDEYIDKCREDVSISQRVTPLSANELQR